MLNNSETETLLLKRPETQQKTRLPLDVIFFKYRTEFQFYYERREASRAMQHECAEVVQIHIYKTRCYVCIKRVTLFVLLYHIDFE